MPVSTDVEASGPVLTVPGAPIAFHVMAKPTGAICNLDCEYCFFLSKEMLYPGSRFRMAEELQETYIRQLLEAHARAPEVVVAWQGGEPTIMGVEFFRRSVELQREYARPGQRILNTLQTNGTLIDDEWASFLKENDFLVGISIDGPREIHDTYRVDKGGKPTFDRVIRGLERLKRPRRRLERPDDAARRQRRPRRPRLPVPARRARSDVHPVHPDHRARDRRDARRSPTPGWGGHVNGRPLYTQHGELVTHRSIGPEQYGRFMIDVFEEWVRRDIGTRVRADVRHRAGELGRRAGRDVRPRGDVRAAACARAQRRPLLLRPLRRTGLPAGQHHPDADAEQLVASPQQTKFGQDKRDTLTQYCLDCDVRFACNGGCPKDRFATSPYGEPGQHYLCPGYKLFFHHVREPMRTMADLLAAEPRTRRADAELRRRRRQTGS